MDDRRNYYRVLHLQPDAPIELVRVNYRTLMQKLGAHPDLGGENWSAAHLNDAYRTLSDPERRSVYDRELLSRFDLEAIAQGRAKPRARKAVAPRRGGENRRNYYRILQAQFDAPFEILEASHRALRGAQSEDPALLDEALAFLSDPQRRATYDRLLDACGHDEAMARIRQEPGNASSGYEPLITAYCAFCKSPHAALEDSEPDARCAECRSPLCPPPSQLLGLARRALERLARADPATLYADWPAPGVPGRVVDLSPVGMRFTSALYVELNDVVKVESAAFDAVGSVAHVGRGDDGPVAGLSFLAVLFPHARGNFRSLKA